MDDYDSNVTLAAQSTDFTILSTTEELLNNGNFSNGSSSSSKSSGGLFFQAKVIVAVFSSIISFITVAGNTCVFYIVCTDKKIRTYTNYYILALSISDIIAGGFTMPLYSVYWILGYWPFSDMLCDVYLFLNQAFIHISIIMIVAIAYDRWDALEHPFQHLQRRTLNHAMKLISPSYILPLVIWFLGSFLWPYIKGSRNILPGRCYPQYVADSFEFLCIVPVIIFWGPFVIICVLYARIYQIIRRTAVRRKSHRPVNNATNHGCVIKESTSTTNMISKVSATVEVVACDNPVSTEDTKEDEPPNNPVSTEKTKEDVPPDDSHEQQTKPPMTTMNISHSVFQEDNVGKENIRATRTLNLILIAMVISSSPWSALAPVYSSCPSCIPLALYQVS